MTSVDEIKVSVSKPESDVVVEDEIKEVKVDNVKTVVPEIDEPIIEQKTVTIDENPTTIPESKSNVRKVNIIKIPGASCGFSVKKVEPTFEVDHVDENSPASKAGFSLGDHILGYASLSCLEEAIKAVGVLTSATITLQVLRGSNIKQLNIEKNPGELCGFSVKKHNIQIIVDNVEMNQPAHNAGIMVGDGIINYTDLKILVNDVSSAVKNFEMEVEHVEGFQILLDRVTDDAEEPDEEEEETVDQVLAESIKPVVILPTDNSSPPPSQVGIAPSAMSLPVSYMPSNMSLPVSHMPGMLHKIDKMETLDASPPPSEVGIAPSVISLPGSIMPTSLLNQETVKKNVAFQVAQQASQQVVKNNKSDSIISGNFASKEGHTVEDLFNRQGLKSVSSLPDKVEVEKEVTMESVYKNITLTQEKLADMDGIKFEHGGKRRDMLSKPFLEDEDNRSVLSLKLDNEKVRVPKIKKLLGIWKQQETTNSVNINAMQPKVYYKNSKKATKAAKKFNLSSLNPDKQIIIEE